MGRRAANNQLDVELIVRQYENGYGLRVLERLHQTSYRHLRAALARHGVQIRTRPGGRWANKQPLPIETIAEQYAEGVTFKQLEKLHHTGYKLIRQKLIEHGVHIRPPGHNLTGAGGWTPSPGSRILSEQEIQRLREAIGFDPSWVEHPEYMYDQEYADG